MSLSAPLPVNSATSLGASLDAGQSAAPDGGLSVFDIILQQIAAETPVQPEAVTAPAANSNATAALMAPDVKIALPETDAVVTDMAIGDSATEIDITTDSEAEAVAPAVLAVAAPVTQPQIQPQQETVDREPALNLPPPAIAVDAKASSSRPDVKATPSTDRKVEEETDPTEPADMAVKDTAEPVRATIKADPKDVLSKVRDAVTGHEPQPVQPAADPRTVSAAAPEAPSPATPSAFSLQAISDTSGSYTATGASTTAGSNMSKAAVESLSALSMQISKKLEQGSTKFAIELYPADLGKVEVSLHIARDGKTTAHLTFDTPVTAASFSASEPELRQQLANAGLSVDKDSLSFSSREGGNGFGSAMAQDQNRDQQSQARHASRALDAARKVADDSDLNAALNTAMNAMRTGASMLALNLIV